MLNINFKALFFIIIATLLVGAYHIPLGSGLYGLPYKDLGSHKDDENMQLALIKLGSNISSNNVSKQISSEQINHILYGDERGGGHKFGVGKPCKSEFPQDWDDAEIIDTVKYIAANDNLDWRREDNGYYVTETFENGIIVRVVLGPKKENIITAYPINVKRNPCPAKPANDN